MSGYQTGDVIAIINGQPMTLRLTVGALAHISDTLNTSGPLALARAIKAGRPADITAIVMACLRPLNGPVEIDDAQAREVFARLSPMFEQAFNTEKKT